MVGTYSVPGMLSTCRFPELSEMLQLTVPMPRIGVVPTPFSSDPVHFRIEVKCRLSFDMLAVA